MRHGKKFNHLGRTKPHREAMLSNMACSLIEHKRINTTVAKAKALRTFIEPLITKSKSDSTHSRRMVFRQLNDKTAVADLFREVAPKVANRPGGYTRIIRTGYRLGDNAEMCMVELVDFNEVMLKDTKPGKSRRRRKKTTSDTTPPASAEVKSEETVTEVKAEEIKVEEKKAEAPKTEEKVKDAVSEIVEKAKDEAKEVKAKATEVVEEVKDKAKIGAEKAKDEAMEVKAKATEVIEEVKEKAKEKVEGAKEKVEKVEKKVEAKTEEKSKAKKSEPKEDTDSDKKE